MIKWLKKDPLIHGIFAFLVIFPLLLALPALKILLSLFVFEDIDGKITVNLYQNVAPKIDEFIKTNKHFPNKLNEANISDKYCVTGNCYTIVYSTDQHNYYLATQANYPFMAFYTSDGINHSFSLSLVEDYNGSRRDFPIYRKDSKYFATPSAWPKLEETSIFKYIPPFD